MFRQEIHFVEKKKLHNLKGGALHSPVLKFGVNLIQKSEPAKASAGGSEGEQLATEQRPDGGPVGEAENRPLWHSET